MKPVSFDRQKRRFERGERPKQPFAPISVAGRSSYSGTLLFYAKGKSYPKIVTGGGVFDLELKLNTRLDNSLGAIDAAMANPPKPVTKSVKLGYFSEQSAKLGTTYRMIDVDWQNQGVEPVSAEANAAPKTETPPKPETESGEQAQ